MGLLIWCIKLNRDLSAFRMQLIVDSINIIGVVFCFLSEPILLTFDYNVLFVCYWLSFIKNCYMIRGQLVLVFCTR